jgi:hypothetical protein
VLLAGAAVSMVVGLVVTRAFFYVWVSNAQSRVGFVVQITLMVTIPVVLFIVALLRVEAGQVRRLLAILITLAAIPTLLVGRRRASPRPRSSRRGRPCSARAGRRGGWWRPRSSCSRPSGRAASSSPWSWTSRRAWGGSWRTRRASPSSPSRS